MLAPVKCLVISAIALALSGTALGAGPRVEVIHWWTSGGEAAAVKTLSEAYKAGGGGAWTDTAISVGEQSRSVTINRIVGGNPPAAAQFNTTKQFLDLIEQGMLNNVDEVAVRDGWEKFLPETVLNVIKVKGHFYAAPVSIHMPTWMWYSKSAFKKAGIADEPKTMDELFIALDKLKAVGIIPLAHGGQSWQENIVFTAVLNNVGGKELYLRVLRDRDPRAINSEAFKKVLTTFKRLHNYVDAGAPGRNWNDATALVVSGRAGIQIMGDWAKGEFSLAKQVVGRDFGCIAGFGQSSSYIIQGDVLVFPKTTNPEAIAGQKLIAHVVTSAATQVDFSVKKGSVPIRTDVDASKMDSCAQKGIALMKDKNRQLPNGEIFLNPDQNGALADILTTYWNNSIPVEKVQKDIATALKN